MALVTINTSWSPKMSGVSANIIDDASTRFDVASENSIRFIISEVLSSMIKNYSRGVFPELNTK